MTSAEVSAASIEVWYSPEDEPLRKVAQIYEQATRYIFVAVYGLTSPIVVKALLSARKHGVDVRVITDRDRPLLSARKHGVDVRVITDRDRLNDPNQRRAVSALLEAGIPVMINRHDGLMHLKQVVTDDEITASGSMNHTTSGNRYNDERLDVIRDHPIAVQSREKFLSMWKDRERFEEWK
ncbi:MAG: hypothetical protein HP491_10980 [Nitrospira sp.]|nr:hypothetical protein [Nitrospira sp.]